MRAIDGLDKPGIAKLLALADSGEKKDTDLVAEVYVTLRTPAAADGLPELLKNYHLSADQKKSLIRSLKNHKLDPKRLISWLDAKDAPFRVGVIKEIVDRRTVQAIPRLERLVRETADDVEAKVARKAIDSLRAPQNKRKSGATERLLQRADDQAAVVAAEAEAVGDGVADAGLAGAVGDVVEVAVGVGVVEVDGRVDDPGLDGQAQAISSTPPLAPEQVADHALGAADGQLAGVVAEDLLDGLGLGHVAQRRCWCRGR